MALGDSWRPPSPVPFLSTQFLPCLRWSSVESGFWIWMCSCAHQHSPPRAPRLPAGLAVDSWISRHIPSLSLTLVVNELFQLSSKPLNALPKGAETNFCLKNVALLNSSSHYPRDSFWNTSYFRNEYMSFPQLTAFLLFLAKLKQSNPAGSSLCSIY